MKKSLWLLAVVIILAVYFLRDVALAPTTKLVTEKEQVSLSIFPASILQGEPALITVSGTTTARSLSWNGKTLNTFVYKGKLTALIGIDFNMPSGSYPVVLVLSDDTKLEKELIVGKRVVAEAPLGIPRSLGGNNTESEKRLVTELSEENIIINSVPTATSSLWSRAFQLPLRGTYVVTDPYGYDRLTGASTIIHKGTDFRAATGTPVYAMNSGVVRLARRFTDYGNTIVIDHGLGLQTLYMHLSLLNVYEGESVSQGELIAKSGDTGYVLAPHLHISVRVNGISIDPIKFLELWK